MLVLAVVAVTALPPAGAAEPVAVPASLLLDAKRIVALGDSITYDGRWLADLVAWMEREGTAAEVIDMGLSSETVSGLSEAGHAGGRFPRPDLFERLDRVLRLARPDVVLACYGMNCGIYQPLDAGRFARFKAGMERLHAAVEKSGAKIVHLTPPVYDVRRGPQPAAEGGDYDAVLTAYSEWLLAKRADGWLVIDVHGPMQALLAARRAADPAFTFAPDAIHPDDAGHWAICRAVLAGLGDHGPIATADSPAPLAAFRPEVTRRLQILRDAYLAAAGHLRPGVAAGLTVAEAEAQAARLTESIRSRRLHLAGRQLPSGEWVSAIEWPRPRVVDPGPAPAGPAPVPADAVVLLGKDLSAWKNADAWKVEDGVATVGKGQITTKQGFGDCQLHVEFRMPAPATGTGQGRGNSGVYFMERYEIQVLDSFADGTDGPLTYPDGQCGALYKQQPPAVNACRRPGEWQAYDILFTRPRFKADGSLEKPGRVSVLHNGVAIHADTVIKGPTAWHMPPTYEAHADALPIALQDHGNPVQFRNIWVRPFEPVRPASTLAAGPPARGTDPPLRAVFNGRDFTGWKRPAEPYWRIENGVLVGESDADQKGSMLYTEKAYGDVVFEAEFRFSGDVDTGIMLRDPEVQVQIGASRSLQRDMTGSFYVGNYPEEAQAKRAAEMLAPGDWNRIRVEARGDTFTVWLNGERASTYTSTAHARPAPIGLQIHQGLRMKVEFRNLKAAEL